MRDEICVSVNDEMPKKKAYLVLGVTNRDTMAGAATLLARLEYETGARWDHFAEEKVICDFVEKKGLHPLCRKEWLKPIKNSVIVDLLDKCEKALLDGHSAGVIISGPFLVDKDTRKDVQDILESEGFEVEVTPISSRLMRVMANGYQTGDDTNSLFWVWKMFNEQFGRTYKPDLSLPKAVIVDNGFLKDKSMPGYATAIKMLASLQDECAIVVMAGSDDIVPDIEGIKFAKVLKGGSKAGMFWSNMVYHYNVVMALEGNANDVIRWHQINVPCMSLICQLALERIV